MIKLLKISTLFLFLTTILMMTVLAVQNYNSSYFLSDKLEMTIRELQLSNEICEKIHLSPTFMFSGEFGVAECTISQAEGKSIRSIAGWGRAFESDRKAETLFVRRIKSERREFETDKWDLYIKELSQSELSNMEIKLLISERSLFIIVQND